MKKVITCLTCIIVLLCSCSKSFLEEEPLASVSVAQFYQSAKDITAAMSGMYGSFQQNMMGEKQFYNRMTYWGEARSDNYERGGNSGNKENEMQLNSLTASNDWADWTPLYRTIGLANLLIKYIPQAAQLETNKALVTPAINNNNMAQAYAMRAVCYFYIVRNWGDAVIRTEPYQDITREAASPRSPKNDVFDKVIIPDLLQAYSLIDKSSNTTWYISEGAICATLVDVYMWRKDYPNAIKWFQNLAKAKSPTGKVYGATAITDLQPQATWNAMFTSPTTSIETIWNINWDFSTNACACMAGVSTSPNNTPIIIDLGIFTNWPLTNPTDIRVKATFDINKKERDRMWKYYVGTYGPPGAGGVTGTYTVAAAAMATTVNVYPVMYRLGDQYLLYAEALNKTGDKVNSLKYLNFIRNRAGLPSYLATDPAVATPDLLEDVIIQERQWELFGEGKRWFDLVRTDHVIKIMDPVVKRRQILAGIDPASATGWGTDLRKYLWPLHRNVLNSNKLLVQNPPYSD
ncbi:RagB/SusD family nutrient uptake outer membrane protein [Mucilaginibacter boryungensis]|uniref:RagB/SusD family nutrient uptake outer membrane protein n=1 Tax=Mucilaginibacter boryungensis TaxID=768480 RepID=A0ABR9XM48_9SPHI|nr:RagB/SusD family nutrient uptake outer membrane protein [Mucilaginibacter boryungensis]MBE9668023.1 RagB/SusD family nutrient uptake outer membrane protein [Mucilaginibacter boryungensis]